MVGDTVKTKTTKSKLTTRTMGESCEGVKVADDDADDEDDV